MFAMHEVKNRHQSLKVDITVKDYRNRTLYKVILG